MRSKQRSQRKYKKEMEPSLKEWHATFRGKYIRTGLEDSSYDEKWGGYQRLNDDQSQLPFVLHGKKTYNYIPKGQRRFHVK